MAWVILVWAETSKWKQTWGTQTHSSRRHHSSFGDTPIGLIKVNGGLSGPYINSRVHMCRVDVQPNNNGLNIAVILLEFVPASGHQGRKHCHLDMPSTVMKSLFGTERREEEKDGWAKRKITDIVAVPEWEIRRQIWNVCVRVCTCVSVCMCVWMHTQVTKTSVCLPSWLTGWVIKMSPPANWSSTLIRAVALMWLGDLNSYIRTHESCLADEGWSQLPKPLINPTDNKRCG